MGFEKLVRHVRRVCSDFLKMFIVYWPGPSGNFLRYRYYKGRLKSLGRKSIIDFGVHIVNPSQISIGDNTHIDRWVTIETGRIREGDRRVYHKTNPKFQHEIGEVHIGHNVHIAPYAYLLGIGGIDIGDCSGIASGARIFSVSNHYHNLNDPNDKKFYLFTNRVPDEDQSIIVGPVVMEKNTGVGLNSVVLPGSTIGENSWVGVLSCVMGMIPPNVIVMGCPAKVIKNMS
jgi:acetyltransferase-like isoleucine patch superfamily enzyme